MDDRKYLKKGDIITLSRNIESSESAKFEIDEVIGEGAFVICYSAKYENKSGRLKQFCPVNSTASNFNEICEEYLSGFKLLEQVRNEKPDALLLNNFVPVHEIFFDNEQVPYIWTPYDKIGLRFNEYVENVRKNYNDSPTKKLYNVLQTILTLTDCIKVFHSVGLLHLDIKPENFLVVQTSDGDINPYNISIFDLNSLYNLESDLPYCVAGTDGFSAPELKQGRLGNRADIYSIGCVLFNAIIINKAFDKFYHEEYFDNINQLISNSELINASVVNSNFGVQAKLVRILKKCLAHDARKRYDSCEQLMLDLRQAIALLVPSIQSEVLNGLHKKAIIIDDESEGISSPRIILQNLLYKTPLFKLENQSAKINVITIGAGNFAQRFIDEVLQIAQIPFLDAEGKTIERELSINTFSNNPEYDKDLYLSFRPAIKDFVNVNGSLNGVCENYGQLNFLPVPPVFGESHGFSVNDTEINAQIADEIISKFDSVNYIFVAVGDDQLNLEIAKAFVDATQSLGMCITNIAFVVQDKDFCVTNSLKAIPVYIAEKVTPENINANLENMAWNAHLSWLGSLNGANLNDERVRYLQRYNHESSLAFALSIRYKLMAVGINDENYSEAAKEFAEKIKDEDMLNTLSYYEHRRWILEKISLGWKPMLKANGTVDYNHCILMAKENGKPQDDKNFLHHCIVRSSKELSLQNSPERWNDLIGLDELDRMSAELNQAFRRKAEEFKNTQPMTGNDLQNIRYEIGSFGKDIQIALKKLEFYLKRILAGNKNHSKNFKSYIKEFLEATSNLPAYVKETVKLYIENLRRNFIVVVEANLFRDYKLNDVILIKNIPFILTFKQPVIAIPFDDGRIHGGNNSEIFKNVAAVSVLNPKEVIFLYCFDEYSRLAFFYDKIGSVLSYLEERKIQSKIRLIVAVKGQNSDKSKNEVFINRIQKRLAGIKFPNFQFEIILCQNYEEISKTFLQILEDNKPNLFEGTTNAFSSNYWNGFFTQRITIPYFEFNIVKKRFEIAQNCEHLNFVSDNSFIRVNDLFALRHTKVEKFNAPTEYIEYHEKLWRVYTNNQSESPKIDEKLYFYGVDNWTRLCGWLSGYDNEISNFFRVRISLRNKTTNLQAYQYILPVYSKVGAERLLQVLREYDVIENDSNLIVTGDSIRIDIKTKWSIKSEMDRLFSQPSELVDSEFVNVKKIDDNITIFFRNLHVKNLQASSDVSDFILSHTVEVLRQLAKAKLIMNLETSPDNRKISFIYSSNSIKKLLTMAGMILEIHIYFSALKIGWFDDIVANFEFAWDENAIVTNEFDCVLTKGFSSIIVEAKARQAEKITQETFQKFSSLVDDFGISSKKVFISNTANLSPTQRERAGKMGIIIVDNPKDIINIGETLKKIMEGKFIGTRPKS